MIIICACACISISNALAVNVDIQNKDGIIAENSTKDIDHFTLSSSDDKSSFVSVSVSVPFSKQMDATLTSTFKNILDTQIITGLQN